MWRFAKSIHFAFLVCFAADIFLNEFKGEFVVDITIAGLFTVYFFLLTQRRSINAVIRWARFTCWCFSFLYFSIMLLYFWEHSLFMWERPTPGWRALTHSWGVFSFLVAALSTPSFIRFFSKLQENPARFITFVYTAVALFSSFLLVLPISLRPGYEISTLDAFFTSVSAISGTGLVVTNTAESFSLFGQFIILLVMQAGGVGIMTFSGILLMLIGKELGLHEKVIQDQTERMHFTGSVKSFAGTVAAVTFIVEGFGALFILPWTYQITDGNLGMAIFHAVFQSVSSFCTAGFSSLPQGMEAAHGAALPLIVLGVVALIGMLGLPTILAIVRIFNPKEPDKRLGPYPRMELMLAILVAGFGTLSVFVVEMKNRGIYNGLWDQLVHAFFQSSMRAAGFNSVVIADMSLPAIFILMTLMVIGGAPMSTAGGVKTSSIGMLLVFVWGFIRGDNEAHFAGRRIPTNLFVRAVSLIFVYFSILFVGFMGLVLTQDRASPLGLLFEAISALSVTGWSLNVTTSLDAIGKSIIIVLMMVGRIGLLTGVYALVKAKKPSRSRYPQGEFYVG